MSKLITISGLDGSGKSTQIKMLTDHFKDKGERVHYFHAVQFSLPQVIKQRLKGSKPGKASQEKAVTSASALSILLRKIVLPIDVWRFRRLLNKLSGQGVGVVLSDRYFYDNLINIAYLQSQNHFMRARLPKPDAAFFLNATPSNIMKRPRAPEQGINYLKAKQTLYKKMAKDRGLLTIDGDQSPKAVFKAILAKLGQT